MRSSQTKVTMKPKCLATAVLKPKKLTIAPDQIYLRLILDDVSYQAEHSDLLSETAGELEKNLTNFFAADLQRATNNGFLMLKLLNLQPGSSGCLVVDLLANFNLKLSPNMISQLLSIVNSKTTSADGPNTRPALGLSAVFYIGSSHQAVKADSLCTVFIADKLCQNGGTCFVDETEKPACMCLNADFRGKFCEKKLHRNHQERNSGSNINNNHHNSHHHDHHRENSWSHLHIILVVFGATSVLLLAILLATVCWKITSITDPW